MDVGGESVCVGRDGRERAERPAQRLALAVLSDAAPAEWAAVLRPNREALFGLQSS
jgi:hypothetical protein